MMRWSRVVGFAVVVALAGCSSTTTSTPTTAKPPSASASRPNILFLLADDLDLRELAYMPNVKKLLGDPGATFGNYFVSVSLCCPSRSTILRGQYSHNTGVETNGGSNGGFETAHAKGIESSTVGTWLHDAGYRTAYIGKYLNGYPATVSRTYIPPGWDEWDSATKPGDPYSEYNYTLNHNGQLERHGRKVVDYGTSVYVDDATRFITAGAKSKQPWFTYLNVYAPHQPATPARQDIGRFRGARAPRTPSYNEADVSDKPRWVQGLVPLADTTQLAIDRLYRRRIESLQAVDRGVASLVATLEQTGQLQNTYFVFTSDNGFHLGQHRMTAGKQTAYETDIHVPLVVRGPGVAAGTNVTQIVGNVDLAPTFADLGNAKAPSFVDGRSFAPLLHGQPAKDWRNAYLIEHWTETDQPDRGGVALEPADPDQGAAVQSGDGTSATTASTVPARPRSGASRVDQIPEYHAVRTSRYTYVEYVTGERELYDLTRDPDELNNLVSTADRALLAQFHDAVAALAPCKADTCRSAEARPTPGG